jgi:endonuclease/exonuclease/phosphatase family metal-dependent hydrolase
VLTLALIACSPASGNVAPPGAAVPPDAVEPSEAVAVIEGEESVTLKLLSFNVLYGAGVDRRFDVNIPQRFKGINRMAELMTYLREARPDILAVQEAGGWRDGVAAQIAADLGMNYVIAQDLWDLDVVLFSRFPIIEAAAVTRTQGFNGVVLKAKLVVADNLPLNVFVTHLYSMSSQTRACQIEALKAMVSPYLGGRTVLIGDMNFRPESNEAQALLSAGWQLVARQDFWRVDQIWVDPSASYTRGTWWEGLPEASGISDHLPIGADVTLTINREATPRQAAQTRPPSPQAMEYACAIPTPRPTT